MGKARNVDMSSQEVKVKKVEVLETENPETAENAPAQDGQEEKKTVKPRRQHTRSKKYAAIKSKVDRTRKYDLLSALELVKQLSYSKFTGTITADIEVTAAELSAEVTLPHSTGQQKKVVIVDDKVLAQIEEGKMDFDILVSSPEYMPKLAKYARTLGPKGMMPNPKNGTLSPNPERAAKELAGGKQLIKAEKKQPLMHVSVGKTDMDTKELIANIKALVKALQGKAVGLTLSATMSPGVKVDLDSI